MFIISETPGRPLETVDGTAAPVTKRRRKVVIAPYLYVLPAITLLVMWIYRPLVQTFQLSFYRWNLLPTAPRTAVGFKNYATLMQDQDLGRAVLNTIIYILAFLLFSVVLPLVIALLSQRVHGRAKTIYQALIFVPFLVTPVATVAVWRWLFDPYDGIIVVTLRGLFGWDIGSVFRDQAGAMIAIIIIVGWQMLGFGVLVMSAGMAGISTDYSEAASVDGAGGRSILWRITLPLLSPTLLFLALMTILLSAQWTYPMIDILTQGGPDNATTNVYYLLYEIAFNNFDAGMAGAAGTVFFIVFGVIALVLVRLSDKFSFYDN
ncbi:sugar ABC transporter permease [Raineyella sp. LH-20]|uniref:carbohydrate ABC transporter permease n=1 Tax=Raineyella sp. LH-20 TaxID=3081204 RepID=UPI002955DDAD|nr:sugar ABC transporter permease [Raineyella sp. LH-20]WOP19515.1 sugar ABC transporter permease [Raineyella sp. LH-20]